MTPIVVSAHNPMTGPRHLGHYVSTMIDWPRLQEKYEIFVVIDDLIASILYPRGRHEIQKKTFNVAREFLATGIDPSRCHVVLTSMLPEIHEFSVFTGCAFDHYWCSQLYRESFAGLLNSFQRRELSLPRYTSVTEVVYPQLALATLTLGLQAEFFQGGEEMRGYLGIMEAICERLGEGSPIRAPQLLTSKCTFLVGIDGRHMASENAVFLSSSKNDMARDVERVSSSEVFKDWYEALGRDDLASRVIDGPLTTEAFRQMTDFLYQELARFGELRISNAEIVDVLERSAVKARQRLREALALVKHVFGVPGFA